MSNILIILLPLLLVIFKLFQFSKKGSETTESRQGDLDTDDLKQLLQHHPLQTAKLKALNQEPKNPWDSFFGGHAYWPNNKAYPLSSDGQAMKMIAQINCKDIIGLSGFPKHGLLQFFIANDDMYGLNFDHSFDQSFNNAKGHQVFFHPAYDENSPHWQIQKATSKDHYSPVSGCYAISVAITKETPSPTDYRFDELIVDPMSLSDEVSDWLYENHNADGHKLGGYAHFTQDDPRRYANDPEWHLLFQLDSSMEEGIDIMWGDCGVGNFFIKAEDLSQLDFSRVCYSWDCC